MIKGINIHMKLYFVVEKYMNLKKEDVNKISWIYHTVPVTELKNVSYSKFKFRVSYRDYLFKMIYLIIRNFETHKKHTLHI